MNATQIANSNDFMKRCLLSVRPEQTNFVAVPMFTAFPSATEERAYKTILGVPLVRKRLRVAPDGFNGPNREEWMDQLSDTKVGRDHHIFLDPDNGIRMRNRMPGRETSSQFVEIVEIVRLAKRPYIGMVLCIDQSLIDGAEEVDREEKLHFLKYERNVEAVYLGKR